MIRFFDIIFSLLGIIILLPFMIPIIILLKLTGEHDIFYIQKRIGVGEKEFGLYKFATMLRNSSKMSGGLFTSENDSRILPLGKFLRKTKINEIPQILNIFLGQMSLVGSRPQVPSHFDYYSDEVKSKIKNLRPGLTGVGSIIFRNEEDVLSKLGEDKDNYYKSIIVPYKGELEVWYSNNKTILLYFKIIIATFLVVLFPKSTYFKKILANIPSPPPELKNIVTA